MERGPRRCDSREVAIHVDRGSYRLASSVVVLRSNRVCRAIRCLRVRRAGFGVTTAASAARVEGRSNSVPETSAARGWRAPLQ